MNERSNPNRGGQGGGRGGYSGGGQGGRGGGGQGSRYSHRTNRDYKPRMGGRDGGSQGGLPPFKKPPLRIQPTTLWDYPSQHYGDDVQGDPNYRGATPSYVIWNLLQRYTEEGDLVIDPCCGSGTTLDVARDLKRKALGYDVNPTRDDIFRVDARDLPVEDRKVDFVFIDPPYSTHLEYSDDPRCIGKLSAANGDYYDAMEKVIDEMYRVLKPGGHLGLYVSDSYEHKKGFHALGFELFGRMQAKGFEAIDIVSVVRHNRTLEMGNYRAAAEEENFFLRGFNYLFIMRKPGAPKKLRKKKTRGEKKRFEGQDNWQGDDRNQGPEYEKPEKFTQKGIQFTGDRPKDGPINRKRSKKKKKRG
ncbi:DNA methyltransferase [Poriferisphaera sp. WC338]|uniref:DNA methyltransferase n=1 Tax=Poriferisphaera sp. WC338 TaxID=3425129 RepID=UPI003D815551